MEKFLLEIGSPPDFRFAVARTSQSPFPLSATRFEHCCINKFGLNTKNWYIWFRILNQIIMAKNTSILLGDYFDNFISQQIQTGKFSSASEVVRAALRMFEHEESKKTQLINELKKGEKSGFVKDFDRKNFLNGLHKKYAAEKWNAK